METRTQVVVPPPAPPAVRLSTKSNTLSLHHGLRVSAESLSMMDAAPVTPMGASSSAESASPAAAFSPRDPSTKLAAGQNLACSKLATSPAGAYTTPSSQVIVSGFQQPTIQPFAASSSPVYAAASKRAAAAASVAPMTTKVTSPKTSKSNTGRWTDAEHKLFLKGLETFPYRAWKKIATLIKTRTVVQIRTHAQKYYQKLEKEEVRMKEREQQLSHQGLVIERPSLAEPTPSGCSTPTAVSTPMNDMTSCQSDASSMDDFPTKKKSMVRKRKASMMLETDACVPLPSLPKRMLKEKKFPREKHMSPKVKSTVSNTKFFPVNPFASANSSSNAHSDEQLTMRNVFSRGLASGMSRPQLPPHPLDFDDATSEDASNSTSMILDFADEKPMGEYPFAMDSGYDHGVDNDDLLQLTDDESMDWFSTTTSQCGDDDEGDLLSAAEVAPLSSASSSSNSSSNSCSSDDSMPFAMGRYLFSPLYTEECLDLVDHDESVADCSDFSLTMDEDEDFVLDPEKFLSSYFSPPIDQC